MGTTDDESEYRPRGRIMDVNELNVEIRGIKERMRAEENKGNGHDEQIAKVWAWAEKLEERVRNLEVRMAVIAALSACGGGVAGSILSNLFKN